MDDYRRFTKTDWDVFGGAEPFRTGKEPFIYQKLMNDGLVELTIIADRTGLELHLTSTDLSEEDNIWSKEFPEGITSLRAEGELRQLIAMVNKYLYAPELAYELDHPSSPITLGFEFC